MTAELHLRRNLRFRVDGRPLLLLKKEGESERHVLMKALVFALYYRQYPNLQIEPASVLRYRPDLAQMDAAGRPLFWAECGETSKRKVEYLARRLPTTHLVFARWNTGLRAYADLIEQALTGLRRRAPLELIGFQPEVVASHLLDDGTITLRLEDCLLTRF